MRDPVSKRLLKTIPAFSHSQSQVSAVCRYIERQEAHHHKLTFQEEYLKTLKDSEMDFDNRHIFKPLI